MWRELDVSPPLNRMSNLFPKYFFTVLWIIVHRIVSFMNLMNRASRSIFVIVSACLTHLSSCTFPLITNKSRWESWLMYFPSFWTNYSNSTVRIRIWFNYFQIKRYWLSYWYLWWYRRIFMWIWVALYLINPKIRSQKWKEIKPKWSLLYWILFVVSLT